MAKNQMYMIIGVALAVAVITSIITISITGNIIKVQETKTGPDVYTKSEIDKMMYDKVVSYDVISYLSDARIVTPSIISINKKVVSKSISCNEACKNEGKGRSCILSIYQTHNKLANDYSAPVACVDSVKISSDKFNVLSCVCGSFRKVIIPA